MAPNAGAKGGDAHTPRKRKRERNEHNGYSKKPRHQTRPPRSEGRKSAGAGSFRPADHVALQLSTPSVKRKSGVDLGRSGGSALVKVDAVGMSLEGSQSLVPTTWRLLEPMGGRMSDIDPIFTPDERYLIIAYDSSIQVFSTADSLLVRRIKMPWQSQRNKDDLPRRIDDTPRRTIAMVLSAFSPDFVWLGCSDGSIWRVEWTTGSIEHFQRKPEYELASMASQVLTIGGEAQEVLFTSERAGGTWQVVAYDCADPAMTRLALCPHDASIQELRSGSDGRVLVGASAEKLLIGELKTVWPRTFREMLYQFYSVDLSDGFCSLDVRSSGRQSTRSDSALDETPVLDVVVGCVRGAIFVYSDILARLREPNTPNPRRGGGGLQPRKLHWHRKAVHSVKWSRDGNYCISGGTETVLVLWQTDTGRREYLPHLSAVIENIVVSPRGSSYGVHLDDNSTMVLSTAEMKPTSYVSGLQSLVLGAPPPRDAAVERIWRPVEDISRPIPMAINPADPSRVLLCVGSGRAASMVRSSPSTPLLQTFDITTFRSVSKQPLARTNPTDGNTNPKGFPITEPTITHLCVTPNGRWLASVDEWEPPAQDIGTAAGDSPVQSEWAHERREIHLKFWEAGKEDAPYELVSRIDGAHFTDEPKTIFGVAADASSHRFATIGDDSTVRLWGLKTRSKDGIITRDENGRALASWYCTQAVPLGESTKSQDELMPLEDAQPERQRSGALTFSEDGSTLFVAFGSRDEAVLYILDGESGEIRHTVHDMFSGDVRAMEILGSSLILLSDELKVYDVVADELRYGIRFKQTPGDNLSLAQLAIGRRSQRFAVSVPCYRSRQGGIKEKPVASQLAIFSPEQSHPLFLEEIPSLIVSLLPAVQSSGFLAVDSTAQVWSVVDATDSSSLAQPLADLNLDTKAGSELEAERPQEASAMSLVLAEEDEESDEEDEEDEEGEGNEEMETDDEGAHEAVIAPQRLADLFDAAPAFAMPPIEELFYQVTGLLSSKPLVAPSAS